MSEVTFFVRADTIEVQHDGQTLASIAPTGTGFKIIGDCLNDNPPEVVKSAKPAELLINLIKREESELDCDMHGSIEHMQSVTGL